MQPVLPRKVTLLAEQRVERLHQPPDAVCFSKSPGGEPSFTPPLGLGPVGLGIQTVERIEDDCRDEGNQAEDSGVRERS